MPWKIVRCSVPVGDAQFAAPLDHDDDSGEYGPES
jgi:hypothetical protein